MSEDERHGGIRGDDHAGGVEEHDAVTRRVEHHPLKGRGGGGIGEHCQMPTHEHDGADPCRDQEGEAEHGEHEHRDDAPAILAAESGEAVGDRGCTLVHALGVLLLVAYVLPAFE